MEKHRKTDDAGVQKRWMIVTDSEGRIVAERLFRKDWIDYHIAHAMMVEQLELPDPELAKQLRWYSAKEHLQQAYEKILQETTIEVSNDSLNIVPNPSSTTPSEATKPHHKDRKTVSSPTILHTKVPKSLPSLQTIQGSPTNAQVTTTTTTTTTTPKNRKEYVCRDYIYGVCKRGKDCRFSHVLTDFYPKEIADLPREVPVCKNYLKGKCTRADCRFRHPKSTDADYNDIMAHHASTTTNLLNVLEYSTNIESFKSPYIFL